MFTIERKHRKEGGEDDRVVDDEGNRRTSGVGVQPVRGDRDEGTMGTAAVEPERR